MDMAEYGIFFFVDLYDAVEKFFDTEPVLLMVGTIGVPIILERELWSNLFPVSFQFVVHVEGDNHTYVHIDQLAGQIQIAFQVGCIDYIDYDVWLFFIQMLANIEFFRGVSR